MTLGERIANGWNAFMNKDPTLANRNNRNITIGMSSSSRPDRLRLSRGNERSIVTTIYNRIAVDVSSVSIKHVKLDDNDRYISTIDSGLNDCLTLSANIDQTGRQLIQDAVMSMFDEGCVAILPTDTKNNPFETDSYEILKLRTGKILDWYPRNVKLRAYNEKRGIKQDIILPKSNVAIIENPFYAIMNEPNSTMQRLIRKLNLLDIVDEQSGSGKLDMIIQLPYVIKTESRKKQAENRRKDIEKQLSDSKYGIAYTDGTERIQQLNRSVDNNLMKQVEYLTDMVYAQLGITTSILDGTADEKTMLNYHNRVLEPILSAIVTEMKRKFLTKTARTQKQSILFFNDPFKLVPVNELAEIADKFTRNEILSSNEIRQVVGYIPVNDTRADELRNKNLNAADGQTFASTSGVFDNGEYVGYEEEKPLPERRMSELREEQGGIQNEH